MVGGIRPRHTLRVTPVALPDAVRKTPAALARAREAKERERVAAEQIAAALQRTREAAEDELFGIFPPTTEGAQRALEAVLENTTNLDTRIIASDPPLEDVQRALASVVRGTRNPDPPRTWLSEQIGATRRQREELGRRLASEAGITNDADALRALRTEAELAEARQRRDLLGAPTVEVFAQTEQVVAINGVEFRIPGGRSMVPKPFADLYRQSFRERAAPISYRADSKMGWCRL